MVIVLASGVVDCAVELRLGQAKDYTIGICCFSAKHTRSIKEKEEILVDSE